MTVTPSSLERWATALFCLAGLHTLCVKRFAHWAHQFPSGSVQENFLHFLAETEVVFGLWATALFLGIAVISGSVHAAEAYIEGLNVTEPKFVLAVMVVAATRPVVRLAEAFISVAALRQSCLADRGACRFPRFDRCLCPSPGRVSRGLCAPSGNRHCHVGVSRAVEVARRSAGWLFPRGVGDAWFAGALLPTGVTVVFFWVLR